LPAVRPCMAELMACPSVAVILLLSGDMTYYIVACSAIGTDHKEVAVIL
jgi:hypothetical protein